MAIIRRAPGANFTILPNDTIRDSRIELDTLGLLAKILSRPENWEIRFNQLRTECGVGRDRLRRMLTQLETTGYLVRHQVRLPNGRFDWACDVYQTPQPPAVGANTSDRFSGAGAEATTMPWKPVDGPPGDEPAVVGKPIYIERQKNKNRKTKTEPEKTLTRVGLVLCDQLLDWAAEQAPLVDVAHETRVFQTHLSGQGRSYRAQLALQADWKTWILRGQRWAQQNATPALGPAGPNFSDTSWAHDMEDL